MMAAPFLTNCRTNRDFSSARATCVTWPLCGLEIRLVGNWSCVHGQTWCQAPSVRDVDAACVALIGDACIT
jgi:hypothetical protein